jgi:hypothetical protein
VEPFRLGLADCRRLAEALRIRRNCDANRRQSGGGAAEALIECRSAAPLRR